MGNSDFELTSSEDESDAADNEFLPGDIPQLSDNTIRLPKHQLILAIINIKIANTTGFFDT